MDVLRPATLDDALAMKAARPEAVPLAGGTDLMVAINFDRLRPGAVLDISGLRELQVWRCENGTVSVGAGVTYTRIAREFAGAGAPDQRGAFVPMIEAARSVGSPQIRNRGTVGGNLGTASPAGDALPVLSVYDADVVVGRAGGTRTLPLASFLTGPKQTALAPDELILGTHWTVFRGRGSFSKVGPRNAMVIAVASLCLVVDEDRRQVRVALGSVGPTVLRAPDAEAFAARALTDAGFWERRTAGLSQAAVDEFGERVAAAARPIDDVRGTAAYRRHACTVLARRALAWALDGRRAA